MRLAIVAILAVGAVGLTAGGLTMTDAFNYPYKPIIVNSTPFCAPVPDPIGGFLTIVYVTNTTPFPAEITLEYLDIEPKTIKLEPREAKEFRLQHSMKCNGPPIHSIYITNGKLNMTSTESFDIYTNMRNLEIEKDRYLGIIRDFNKELGTIPTAFYGTITASNGTGAGIEVIAVNVADHSDVKRDITNSEGDYFIRTAPGGYLIQAIGGGPESYRYVTIESGLERIDLTY